MAYSHISLGRTQTGTTIYSSSTEYFPRFQMFSTQLIYKVWCFCELTNPWQMLLLSTCPFLPCTLVNFYHSQHFLYASSFCLLWIAQRTNYLCCFFENELLLYSFDASSFCIGRCSNYSLSIPFAMAFMIPSMEAVLSCSFLWLPSLFLLESSSSLICPFWHDRIRTVRYSRCGWPPDLQTLNLLFVYFSILFPSIPNTWLIFWLLLR